MNGAVNDHPIPHLPRNSIIFIIVCLAGLLGFTLVALLPNQRALKMEDRKMLELEIELKKQEKLFPVFQKIYGLLSRKDGKIVPFAKKEGLSQAHIGELPAILRQTVEQNGMQYEKSVPDVSSLKNNSNHLLVLLTLRGDFFRFQAFLAQLGKMVFLDQIESISINAEAPVREYQLRLWILLENSKK